MSKSLKSIIVLTSICLIVALSLSLVNSITAPIISRQAGDEAQKKLSFMLPGSELEKLEFDTEKYPSVQQRLYGRRHLFSYSYRPFGKNFED